MFSRPSQAAPRPGAIAGWLTFVAVLIFLMVIVGGITRLTESGLSMVRWDPISGIDPAAQRGRLAGRVRPLPADARNISRSTAA